jgi:hypothetical protein
MTNAQYANTNDLFKHACFLAKIPATKRQASKWHNRYGKASKFRAQAIKEVRELS